MASWKFFLNNIEVEEPIGWDGVEFTAQRMDEHGIDQPFSTEITFYGKGAKLIKSYYDTQFINAEIKVRIESDVSVAGFRYEFLGYVNMALYSEKNVCDTDSWEITVGIIDDNFREKFKSRMDVDVDIYSDKDLDGNDLILPLYFDNTRLHTQEVYLVGYARNIKAPYPIAAWADIYWTYSGGWVKSHFAAVLPAYKTSTDFNGAFGTQFDPAQVMWSQTNVIFKNNANYARTLTFNIKTTGQWQQIDGNTAPVQDTTSLALLIGWNSSNEIGLEETAVVAFPPQGAQPFDLEGTATVTVNPGEGVRLYYQFGGSGTVYPGADLDGNIGRTIRIWVKDCCVAISEKNGGEYASFADTLRAENFLRRLIFIMTGNPQGLVSDAFSKSGNGCYWNYALTNGLKIRRANPIDGAELVCDPLSVAPETNFKVSFKRVFDGLSSIFCLGWAFQSVGDRWVIRIEPVEYFYKNQIEFTAINVGELTQSAMVSDLANQFKIGYDDTWKNIQVAGIWAIHTDRNYYVNNRAMSEGSTKKMEVLSNIIAEGYAIEFSRRMFFFQDDSGSSDRPNDYSLFIIWLNRNDLTINDVQNSEYRLPPTAVENGTIVFAPGTVSMSSRRIAQSNSEVNDLYNINITPARNALRWWKILGMHTFGVSNPRLMFRTGEYQIQYSSKIDESWEPCQVINPLQTVAENMDIGPTIIKDGEKEYLFRPIEIEFDYPQSLCDFINLADNNPYGKVRLTSGSLTVSGYIQSITNKPEDNNGGTTSFVLLASNIPDPSPQPPKPPGLGPYNDGYNDAYL